MVHVMKNPSLGKCFLGGVLPVSMETLQLSPGGGPEASDWRAPSGSVAAWSFYRGKYNIDIRFAILTL